MSNLNPIELAHKHRDAEKRIGAAMADIKSAESEISALEWNQILCLSEGDFNKYNAELTKLRESNE